jgi:hypothetical protein
MEQERRIPVWLLPLAGVAAVVILVLIGLNREPAAFDPDTPEGTVQAYIGALVEGDFETAAAFWSEDGCVPSSIEPIRGAPDISATLVRADEGDDEATVVIRITENVSDPVTGIYEYQEWFSLVRSADGWQIRQPSWPYYDQACEEVS